MSTEPELTTIEQLAALTEKLITRDPRLTTAIIALLSAAADHDQDVPEDFDERDAAACFRFHLEHPRLAEMARDTAQQLHEQGLVFLADPAKTIDEPPSPTGAMP